MIFAVVAITALLASFLTFFSGFGLGTLLMPVFALFFDLPVAIGLTAIVHLLNNFFKLVLVYKNIDYTVLLRFGIPALIASFAGAWVLGKIDAAKTIIFSYSLLNYTFHVTYTGVVIGITVLFFSVVELSKTLSELNFHPKWLTAGGVLTGFIGGLSGHQGAIRSAFLLRLQLNKTVFIATGVSIACLVDLARLSVYSFKTQELHENLPVLAVAVFSAFTGAFVGNKVFKKTSIAFAKWMTGLFMLFMALLMIAGIINK
jgi:uncharacterized membrane protein YfcA